MLNRNRFSRTITLVIGAACIIATAGQPALAACDPPHYREAVVYANSQASTIMQISIQMADFAPSRLLCLAEALKRNFPGRQQIAVNIFSSYDAAKHYRVVKGDWVGKRPNWDADMHGGYFYDADKHVEYVEILPLGAHSAYATRIDLPSSSDPQCQLQIADRCLLASGSLEYPEAALKPGTSGTVALAGTIDADGKLTKIHVARANVPSDIDGSVLREAAIRHFKSWRFEPKPKADSIQITYTYEISAPDSGREKPAIEFDLPHDVIIRAKPH